MLRNAVPEALTRAGVEAGQVIGIGTDFTACTVLPTLADGTPLCELPGLENRPHAYVKLWRHHAAQDQADRMCGTYVRNACTAGYKGQYQDGRYPSPEYLAALHPDFADFVADKLDQPIGQLGEKAGRLTAEASALTGLPEGVTVCVGNVDAHVTAPAAVAVEPGQMVAIMGTSTCHIMSSDQYGTVPGMCGVVDGGILPGLWGYEAGQSGVGDIFAWFIRTGFPAEYAERAAALGQNPHEYLTDLAARQKVGAHGLIALDGHSGNRSVLVDHDLSGLLLGQTLSTRSEDVYRALLEATAFGTRTIIDAFESAAVPVRELIIAGGLTKNALLMQIYADVTRRPLSIVGSAQGPALGAAMHAAVAAGAYDDIRAAARAMGSVRRGVYPPDPDPDRAAAYDRLYAEYRLLHDYFGRGTNDVMHRLRRIRAEAAQHAVPPL